MAKQPLDSIFSAMSDTTRRAVVERLTAGPASVSELAAPHPMALPTFLRHLGVLETAGLIVTDKQGRTRQCRLAPGALAPAQGWMAAQAAALAESLEAQTDRLADFLNSKKDLS